jgi:acyl dehydratase
VGIDAARVASYRDVCGFTGSELPTTYLHVLAFPLQLVVMTTPAFPFAPLGVVHIANTIKQLRALSVDDEPDLRVSCGAVERHPRGRQVSLLTEFSIDGELVWQSESVMLSRERAESAHEPAAAAEPPALPEQPPSGPQVWRLPSNLGRRYAAVSGDRNPIHLYDLTAMPFGFRRHIAHGMWTKARCLAELHNQLPEAFRVEVAFRKPLTLPGSATFGARRLGHRLDFGVSSPTSGSAHLLGRITEA